MFNGKSITTNMHRIIITKPEVDLSVETIAYNLNNIYKHSKTPVALFTSYVVDSLVHMSPFGEICIF